MPVFLEKVKALGDEYGAYIPGCGHVGDGNVHLSVFLPDDDKRDELLLQLFQAGVELGGAISGEHGLGLDKRDVYLALTDPALVDLQRRIKSVFDPQGLLQSLPTHRRTPRRLAPLGPGRADDFGLRLLPTSSCVQL